LPHEKEPRRVESGRNDKVKKRVVVNDLMQTDYVYYLTEPVG